MQVQSLNVDLVSDHATISLIKQAQQHVPGKPGHSSVLVQVPIQTPGNQPEGRLKQAAVQQAIIALTEAITALRSYQG